MRSDTGRHQLPATRRPGRLALTVAVLGTAAVVGALAAPPGAHGADPIDADPVATFATVVSAPACTAASSPATVELAEPVLRASLDACGLPPGQRVAVEYLRGEPGVARLAGTSTSGAGTESGRWAAVGLAVLALFSVLVVVLLSGRRRGRPDDRMVTVAELVARLSAPPAAPSTTVPSAGWPSPVSPSPVSPSPVSPSPVSPSPVSPSPVSRAPVSPARQLQPAGRS